MTNLKYVLAILIGLAIVTGVAFAIAPKGADADTESAANDINAVEMLDVPQEATETDEAEVVAEASTEEVVAEEGGIVSSNETGWTTIDMGNGPESFVLETADTDEPAYADVITAEDIQSVKEFLAAQPDIDGNAVKSFWQKYGGENGYFEVLQDREGSYIVAAGNEMFMQTDLVRPMKSVDMGLNKEQIDDAFAFPFELTEEQIGKILKLGVGQKGDFSDAEIEKLKIQLFQFLFGHPHALEAYIELLNQQKIADEFYLNEYWVLGNEYLERCKTAREEGTGMNIWYAKYVSDDEKEYHFTTEEYHKYVIGLFNLLWARKAEVAVYTAKAKDHYHLIAGDFNSMRKATPADYEESLASLIFPFYTKTGKIAIRFGANIRDKRPEILNYTVVKKPVAKKKKVDPPPITLTQEQPPIIFGVTTTTTTSPPSGGTPSNPPPGENKEYKSPSEGTKAQTGGGQKSDPGAGDQKPDQGNGNGEYQQGTSENTNGSDQKQYDPGPKADNTDNGKAPETKPIETQTSETEKGTAGGDGSDGKPAGGSAGDNQKAISEPVAED